MTQPLIGRLNVIIKQLHTLNEMIERSTANLPVDLYNTLSKYLTMELSAVKDRIADLHRDINILMNKCYKVTLDTVFRESNSMNMDDPIAINKLNNKENKITFNNNGKSDII